MTRVKSFDEVLGEQLKDLEFKKEFEAAEAEYVSLKNILRAREKAGMTQQDVALRMETTQSAVARLENKLSLGIIPSHRSLTRYARALGKKVVVDLV